MTQEAQRTSKRIAVGCINNVRAVEAEDIDQSIDCEYSKRRSDGREFYQQQQQQQQSTDHTYAFKSTWHELQEYNCRQECRCHISNMMLSLHHTATVNVQSVCATATHET